MTEEALEQYARRVLADALREDWDNTGQETAFVPSKQYESEMRAMLADPEKWCRRKRVAPHRRALRRLGALAALIAVVITALRILPLGGEIAAQTHMLSLSAAAAVFLLAVIVEIIYIIKRKQR